MKLSVYHFLDRVQFGLLYIRIDLHGRILSNVSLSLVDQRMVVFFNIIEIKGEALRHFEAVF